MLQGENSAVPPDFPNVRALKRCNGLTRSSLLNFSGKQLRGDNLLKSLLPRTIRQLSEAHF